jgi:large subunit ribosomal protein L17
MRHQKAGRKLSRTSAHRKALFSNMVTALVTHGRIETTLAKAKELRRHAERAITWSVSVGELAGKDREQRTGDEQARIVHAMRMARRVVKDRAALAKLFSEVGPGYLTRPGGYTRILKTRHRRGDAAPMALVELLPGTPLAQAAATPGGKDKAGKDKADAPAKAAKAKPAKAKAEKTAETPAGKPKKAKKKSEADA